MKKLLILIFFIIALLLFVLNSIYSKVTIKNETSEVMNVQIYLNNTSLFSGIIESLSDKSIYFNSDQDGSFSIMYFGKRTKVQKSQQDIGYISPNANIKYELTIQKDNTFKYREKY